MNNSDSIQLVKCLVKNTLGEQSYRLIERDNFNLWRYLITTRHHITILESTLCLWVSDESFQEREEIYMRAGKVETASRLILMMYDDDGHFNNTCRYCLTHDQSAVEEILKRHLPGIIRDNNQYSLDCETGMIVNSGPMHEFGLLEDAELSTLQLA